MYFRAGAGAVILDERHERVLVLERSDKPEAWQLPQGGIEAGEDPYTAALREVREETGLAAEELALIDRYPEPLVYELPPEHQTAKTGLGQVQYWFLFECKRTPAVIELPDRKEFRAVEWLTFPDLLVKVVEFRRPVYHRLYKHFERHLVARTPQI
jgi:putative (di)nucleoside polyphosphate hydrolase